MSKRAIVVLSLLIAVAIGISAYALIPPLLSEGSGQAVASDTGGGGATVPNATTGNTTVQATGDPEPGGSERTENEANAAGSGSGGAGQGTGGFTQPSGQQGGSGNGSGGDTGGGSGNSPGTAPSQTNPGGSSTGSNSNSNSNSSSAATTTPPPAPPAAPKHTVTLSIDADTVGRGSIMAPRTVEFSEGETVYDVLQRECRASGIPMESSFNPLYNSRYVEGIDNLYEFDGGSQSGWMYAVNGWYPNYGCSVYTVSDGDVITWRYTCNLGSDIGGHYAVG